MAEQIAKEELFIQKEFLFRIKQINAARAAETGSPMRACCMTYGCQQNENDTERIKGMLYEAGFLFCDEEKDADLVIYNTCAVRENAEQKVFGRIGILKHMKKERPDMIIGLCGCMVQQGHITEEIKKKHRHVDLIFGTHALYRFPELLFKAITKTGKKSVIDITDSKGKIAEGIPVLHDHTQKAWVSVMYGCNNFCSYCIVPYVRGRERSRRPEDIIAEIKELIAGGTSEISLLGQNVNSYGKDLAEDIDFAKLLRMVNETEGIKRIRFMTSHPKDLSDDLIDAIAECDKVTKQLHLPVQAGSDKVLADMNRRYTAEDYLLKIEKIKKRIPRIALSTDIIVGFPTETNEDFEKTIDIIKKVRYDSIYSFIYSKREGTPAASLEPVLCDEEIKKNFDRLLAVQNGISKEINDSYVGRTEEVLVDGPSKNDPETLSGRTDSGKVVNFKGDKALSGKFVKVRITGAHTWSLNGELEI